MSRKSPLSNKASMAEAVASSESVSDVLKFFGLRAAGGNFRQVKKWAEAHGISLPSGIGEVQARKVANFNRQANSRIFVENGSYSRTHLKSRLRLIWSTWVCAACGIGEEWNGKALSLQLDHINGVPNDNRLENLRLLCPNCHSQTETFAGKMNKRPAKATVKIPCACGKMTTFGRCQVCARRDRSKIDWPEDEDLKLMVKEHGYAGTGRILRVSDNAVKKRLRRNDGIRTRQ